MYLEDNIVNDVREEAVKVLKGYGVKHIPRKSDYKHQVEKKIEVYHVFKTSLELLEKEPVLVHETGAIAQIPVFVIDSCKFIEQDLGVEGLFRKAGSTCKQRELRALLDCGNRLDPHPDHHPINVANILKLFFRELPEPLIPFKFHNLLLRCLNLKQKQVESILLACLLIPTVHLNTLGYLMRFLKNVSANASLNKMDIGNLAIIFAPSVMPVNTPKLTAQGSEKINHHVQIVQILIENASLIGVIPDNICEKLSISAQSFASSSELDVSMSSRKRKKKRSNSLTRMFSGIKKIMTKSSPEPNANLLSPMNCYTPKVFTSAKRKNMSNAMSAKKKREVLSVLPGGLTLANTPHKIKFSSTTQLTPRTLIPDDPKLGGKVARHSSVLESRGERSRLLDSPLASNRSHQVSWDNCGTSSLNNASQISEETSLVQDYIRIPRNEYEAIKERVVQIENRLENELENLLGVSISDCEDLNTSPESVKSEPFFNKIENAYAKTVEESGKLHDSSTDRLTRKLSRELKIRRSERIIRSPSARKIGSIRRRSREVEVNRKAPARHSSLNTCDRPRNSEAFSSKRVLRRGRPNTVLTGLLQPNTVVSPAGSFKTSALTPENKTVIKSRSSKTPDNDHQWRNAETFFAHECTKEELQSTRRDSVVQIRNKNAGMVLAKAKMFDQEKNVCDSTQKVSNDKKKLKASVNSRKSTGHPPAKKIPAESPLLKNVQMSRTPRRSSSVNQEKTGTPSPRTAMFKIQHNIYLQTPPSNKLSRRNTFDHTMKPTVSNNVSVRRSPRLNIQTHISID